MLLNSVLPEDAKVEEISKDNDDKPFEDDAIEGPVEQAEA